MYFRTATDMAPEITRFNSHGLVDDLGSMHSILRPETIESLTILWRTTKAQIYRNWGQRIMAAFGRMRTPYGYTSLNDVNKPWDRRDDMPSFFVAETLKYFFLLFAEGIAAEQGSNEEQAWQLADILYHILTHVDPEELMQTRKERNKRELADILDREKTFTKVRAAPSSRHSRFGTSMHTIAEDGTVNVSTSVLQKSIIEKGSAIWRKEFRNSAGSEKKQNVFHDPFFVDLEEGSVRQHNQLNPFVKGSLEDGKNHPDAVITGLYKFFEEFVRSSFSTLVSIMRSSCGAKRADVGTEFNRPHLLNFISWFLEFHRHQYSLQASKAKKKGEEIPVIDVGSIQGAIDLDMIQFTTARLKEWGKEANIHASLLVVVLRALTQQVKTVGVIMESSDSDTRDCGDILVQNIIKDDVMAHLSWIMKNFKSSSHDLRILSYAVEVFHHMLRLMKKVEDRQGKKLEFQVERSRGTGLTRATTTTEKEVEGLADARVVENLFHLLEKYRRHSPQLHSMLVKLIYQIVRAHPTNIVIFFELSYFMRIFRLMSDPMLSGGKNSKKYREMVELLQYILRQFFKCAEVNGCVFAELLFRKVPEHSKNGLLENHASEFAAILDNYEDESYKRILDRMGAGESLNAMREKQRAIMKGQLPWTTEEDTVLKDRYAMYADHPLCAELLAAELPEESRRTALQVRRRLVELGLVAARGAGRGGIAGEDGEPPSKKAKVNEFEVPDTEMDGTADDTAGAASPGTPQEDAAAEEAEMLEEDLERLLDAAYDSFPGEQGAVPETSTSGAGAGIAASMDIEKELEALLEEDDGKPSEATATAPSSSSGSGTRPSSQSRPSQVGLSQSGADTLEAELERLMDEGPGASSAASATAASPNIATRSTSGPAASQADMSQTGPDSLEADLERLMDEGLTPATAAGTQGAGRKSSGSAQASQPHPSQEAGLSESVPDSLELDLERLMDEGLSAASQDAATPRRVSQGPSQSGPDTLEADLERLMDESQ